MFICINHYNQLSNDSKVAIIKTLKEDKNMREIAQIFGVDKSKNVPNFEQQISLKESPSAVAQWNLSNAKIAKW